MIDELFNEFGNDKEFQKIMRNMVKKLILDVSNEVKYNNCNIDDEIVKATVLACINEEVGFEFLRSLNLALNGADEVAFGNVLDFINKLEIMYKDAEIKKDEFELKKYGGL